MAERLAPEIGVHDITEPKEVPRIDRVRQFTTAVSEDESLDPFTTSLLGRFGNMFLRQHEINKSFNGNHSQWSMYPLGFYENGQPNYRTALGMRRDKHEDYIQFLKEQCSDTYSMGLGDSESSRIAVYKVTEYVNSLFV